MYGKINIYIVITIVLFGVITNIMLNRNEEVRIEERAQTEEVKVTPMSKKLDDDTMTFYFFKQYPVHIKKVCIDGTQWLLTDNGDIEQVLDSNTIPVRCK